ncbi:UDP-N-acetylmuramoyl-tripeptide--D-alanyl-D-alanine ligase [Kineosporia sp. NBRC 101677]|uniref:UDP-N-acetylmuramoyl-tripeptide--D-alanyl-D- alanine ligase n=1 Tax=Kineosporia sp. NBRC 101677 TaxID=3032197 RepID=UPI0024A02BDC|nr:UDP-N-acetylmuramoyl-tripeptide--D-alanyl-D-alanine ligase [Kineosporia sp. NBRC 101677]GLY19064.1 UDP-N-acetylmuramoyl-tripeptide--D-alanyl-D-alanine ligase [Kineosporia sp. NBRC 101677]
MIPMTLGEIALTCGGEVQGNLGRRTVQVTGGAYLDSRNPVPGGLFVALQGAESDGHDYAAGAHAVLGSRPTDAPTVVVPDPVVALALLARRVVQRVRPRVFALTGSHGKTGTKDFLAAALPGAVATAGNRNNELGVPLTCLGVSATTDQLVLEMGARAVGHLSWLTTIAPPDVASVLNVGSAHVGRFGSTKLIAQAKGELIESLGADGVAVLNGDDPRLMSMAPRTVAPVTTFGRRGEVTWRRTTMDDLGRPAFELGYQGRWAPVRLLRSGEHQVRNAAAAAAMALAVGEALEDVAERLSQVGPTAHRLQPRTRADGLLVLDDTYNSNPDAVMAALSCLERIGRGRSGRTVAVLGEMHELGSHAAESHRQIGALARIFDIDRVVAIGPGAGPTAREAGGEHLPDPEAALQWLRSNLEPEDVVLVKGARAGALDELVESLLEFVPSRPRPVGAAR